MFYREWPSKTPNFQVVANNQLVHKNTIPDAVDKNSFAVLNDKYIIIDTLQVGNGYTTNTHDIIMLENGNHYLMIYDPQLVGMDTVVEGGDPNATVKGFVLQELDPDHNVIFQWRSWDHYEITDANHIDLTSSTVDYVHVNAYDTTTDGNILLCCRHFDEVTKIDRNTGDIIWRFGPKAKNNMFEFSNDTMGFTFAHDIQQLENGNLTLYDNGNFHTPQISRAIEYMIDEVNLEATLVWEYQNDPIIYAGAKGGTRRLDNGNTIIGWGNTTPIISTEAHMDGTKAWELKTDSSGSYRVMKFDWKTSLFETNVDTIDYGYYNGYEPWPVIFTVTNNANHSISITSASNHSDAFYLETILPVNIESGESINMLVNFYPFGMGDRDFQDILTLNYDGYYADTLRQRVSRQISLRGSTIDPTNTTHNIENKILNYPSPTSDFSTIKSTNYPIKKLSIHGVDGKIVYELDNINKKEVTIELTSFNAGLYIANIELIGSLVNIKSIFSKS